MKMKMKMTMKKKDSVAHPFIHQCGMQRFFLFCLVNVKRKMKVTKWGKWPLRRERECGEGGFYRGGDWREILMEIGGYYALVLVVFNCGTVTINLPLRLYNSKIKKH